MPRKPGLPKRKTTIALTWQKTLGLIQPICISTFKFKNDEERRKAWRHNKAAIMALQGKPLDIGEDSSALQRSLKRDVWFTFFERPKAFYEYDRGEILTGCTNKLTIGFKDYLTLDFGLSAYCSPEEKEVYALFGCSYPKAENAIIYEDQKEYLIKNKLLNAAEKAALRAEKAKKC
jgi:hypothetical protein